MGLFPGLSEIEPCEAEIEIKILDYLNLQLRHYAWKNTSAGYYDKKLGRFRKHTNPYAINGTPDIYCQLRNIPGMRGVVIHFEVKSKKGIQTKDQIAFEFAVKKCDGYYFVVRSLEDVKAALRSIGALSLCK